MHCLWPTGHSDAQPAPDYTPFQPNLLERHILAGGVAPRLVNYAIGALADLLGALEVV